jgi:ABC-2 type transport system permease protein
MARPVNSVTITGLLCYLLGVIPQRGIDMNWYGMYTLFSKEVWRFIKVLSQTIITPLITVLLYLLVFSSVLQDHVQVYKNVSYTAFLIPGLIMMSIIQNAFANSSSSLFQSKMTGNIVFMLIAPISSVEFYLAFVAASVVRGICVGVGVWIIALWFDMSPVHNILILIIFTILSSAVLGGLGVIAALWADKWDNIAGFQNFVVLPFSFLSGAFYSIKSLPQVWQTISYYNPFFYMVDGFRYGFLGASDVSLSASLAVITVSLLIVSVVCIWLLEIGYRIRR